MKEILNTIYENLETFILSIGYFGPIIASVVIIFESIIPIIPLCLFIGLNCLILGKPLGILISYFSTLIGCLFSYLLFKKVFKRFLKKVLSNKHVAKVLKFVDKADIKKIAVISAIPFAPAFLINICAGLSNKIDTKTFIIGITIGKTVMVLFWAIIGTSLIESFKHPWILGIVVLMVIMAYIVSKIVTSKFGLE